MLNFVICDDSPSAINKISKMLDAIFVRNSLDGQIVFSTTNSTDLLNFIKNNVVNVAILDVDLKDDISGLQIADKIRKQNKNTYIIFITGHLEFGLVAYKYKTFDYIAKPITIERFEETILRLFDDIYGDNNRYLKLDNDKTIIPEKNIRFIRKDGMKLVVHTDTRDYVTYNSFTKIQDMLPHQFVRCHKSYIVNLDKITDINMSDNTVSFTEKDKCFIGPKYKNNFMEVFKNENFSNNLDCFNYTE